MTVSFRYARVRDVVLVLLALGFIVWITIGAHAAELLNVSYDPTRELYKAINAGLRRRVEGQDRAKTSPSSSRMAAPASRPAR